MTNKNRFITTLILISSIIMVFVSAIVIKEKILTLVFLLIEICAYSNFFFFGLNFKVWY